MRTRFPDVLALGAIAAFAAVLFSINDSWMFVNVEKFGGSDPFIYRGYFMNLTEHLKAFDGLYYTARLPPILIGAAFQNLPDAVGVVLMRLSYAGASAISVYISVARLTDNRYAAVAAVIFLLTDTYVLTAVGNDYVNGAAFAFLCVGTACLIVASESAGRSRWLLLALAGAALATSVTAHILSLMPAAFLCLLFVLLCKDQLGFARALQFALTMIAGAALALIGFGLASSAVGGKFLFFLPQFVAAPAVAAQWMPLNRPAGAGFVLDWYWSWVHLIVAAASIVVLAGWRAPQDAWASRAKAVLFTQVAFVGVSLALDVAGLGIFKTTFNYVYPEVFTILAIGALFGIAWQHENPNHQLAVIAVMALLSICMTFRLDLVPCSDGTCRRPDQRFSRELAIVAIVLVAATFLARSGWWRMAMVSAVAATWFTFSIAISSHYAFDVRGGAEMRRSFLGFLAFSRAVNEFSPPETKYWFDAYSKGVLADPQQTGLARAFIGQAATWLYGYRIVSDAFPSVAHPFSKKAELRNNDVIMALSAACNPPEIAVKALEEAGFFITERSKRLLVYRGISVCAERMKIATKVKQSSAHGGVDMSLRSVSGR